MRDYAPQIVNRRRPRMTRTEIKAKTSIKQMLIGAVAILAFSFMFAIVLLEMAVGCGEPIYKADGTYVTGECIFIPYTPVEGVWQ